MPSKLANAIAVPAAKSGGAGGGGGPSLPDGYYSQTNITDPKTSTGWSSAPAFHNGSQGDQSSGVDTGIVTSPNAKVAFLIAKAAGMTFDNVAAQVGYTSSIIIFGGTWVLFGSNDLVSWTPITFDTAALSPFHAGFAFEQITASNSTPIGPYKYLVGNAQDSGASNLRLFLTDLRIKLAAVDVGA